MGLINKSQVKAFVKNHNLRLGAQVINSIEAKIENVILDGIKRATKNKRTTLMPFDI